MGKLYYLYVDYTDDGHPFYVGKGDAGRVRAIKRNPLHEQVSRHHGQTREVFHASTDEMFILWLEMMLISEFKTNRIRHRDNPYSANLTDGGDGTSGYRHTPEAKKLMSEVRKVLHNTPEMKALKSEISLEVWQREGFREHQSKVQRETSAKPEIKQKRSASQSVAQKRVETREKRKASLAITNAKPEMIEKRRQASLEFFKDPVKKANVKAGIAMANERPEVKANRSVAQKQNQNRPEVREKKSASQRAAYAERITKRDEPVVRDKEDIRRRLQEGQSMLRISRDYHIPYGHFTAALRRHGLK